MGNSIVSTVSKYSTHVVNVMLDTGKLLRDITVMVDEKLHIGVHKLEHLLTINSAIMLVNLIIIFIMMFCIIMWCIFHYCEWTTPEADVDQEPPAYSIESATMDEKATRNKEDGYQV
ncbi:unnamed protein product [Adineta ricciae]|uniref:Uncharacterized protein n=1 Tax=Adineta ricciae TaxID=249248 RepID=A0A815TVL0_ADIRI|nr:unnamed protein product [Adineta ricciae]